MGSEGYCQSRGKFSTGAGVLSHTKFDCIFGMASRGEDLHLWEGKQRGSFASLVGGQAEGKIGIIGRPSRGEEAKADVEQISALYCQIQVVDAHPASYLEGLAVCKKHQCLLREDLWL